MTVPSSCVANTGPTVPVTINVYATTVFGGEDKFFRGSGPTQTLLHLIENVFLAGSVPELGNWSPDKAIALSPANYPIWSGEYPN